MIAFYIESKQIAKVSTMAPTKDNIISAIETDDCFGNLPIKKLKQKIFFYETK